MTKTAPSTFAPRAAWLALCVLPALAACAHNETGPGVTIPQLSIRYVLQLGLLPLPKTANPAHMKSNASVDFEISKADMDRLVHIDRIQDYGDASMMPVFGGDLRRAVQS